MIDVWSDFLATIESLISRELLVDDAQKPNHSNSDTSTVPEVHGREAGKYWRLVIVSKEEAFQYLLLKKIDKDQAVLMYDLVGGEHD